MGTFLTSRHQAGAGQKARKIDLLVLFTDVSGTLEALRSAAKLARGLNARIRLLAPQVVPYPLPLERPRVQPAFLENRYRTIAERAEIETTVELRLCREYWKAVKDSLTPCSTVIIGRHRAWWNSRWWLTREDRIANRLRAEGHQVILVDTK